MSEIERPAARIRQGNLTLYATSLQVRDLRQPNFYRIDTLDADEGTGYQRILNEARAKRLADYLLAGHKALEAFLPTSIFLATDRLLSFDSERNTVRIDASKVGPFNVVDGQHRIKGFSTSGRKRPDPRRL